MRLNVQCNGCFVRVQNKYNTEIHILRKLYFEHEFMCSTDFRNIWILEIKYNCWKTEKHSDADLSIHQLVFKY